MNGSRANLTQEHVLASHYKQLDIRKMKPQKFPFKSISWIFFIPVSRAYSPPQSMHLVGIPKLLVIVSSRDHHLLFKERLHSNDLIFI